MSKLLIYMLGLVARLVRALGLSHFLAIIRNGIDEVCLRLGRPLLRVNIGGIKFYGFLRHRSFLAGLARGKYELYYRAKFQQELSSASIVVDGGAHIGLYSLLASNNMDKNRKVYAFEPDPFNYAALCFNIRANNSSNIVPVQKALSNKVGSAYFYQDQGTISSSLVRRKEITSVRTIEMDTTTLDSELRDQEDYDIVIKLDVEGAELLAIQGMKDVFRKSRKLVVLLEINPAPIADMSMTVNDFIGELEYTGLEVYFLDEITSSTVPISTMSTIPKGNLYCIYEKLRGEE